MELKTLVFMRSFYFFIGLLVAGCSSVKKIDRVETPVFIGEYRLPNGLVFKNTTVGGLSGIDYDKQRNVYYLICDDASVVNPVRFYTARISLGEKGIDSVELEDMVFLKRPDGSLFPNTRENPREATDPEAMRYNAANGTLVFSSEGERRVLKNEQVLADGLIRVAALDGSYLDSFALPSNMHMRSTPNGPRHNSVFEGLTFIDHFKQMYVSVEEPIYEDGPQAGLGDSTAWLRFIRFDTRTKKPVAQYAYRVEAVADAPVPAGAFRLNGVTDLLALSDKQLLVLERSYSTGHKINVIRVFLADLSGASDISKTSSLTGAQFRPIQKKLLLTIHADNIEGMCMGPRLADGRRSLIFISDNNFSKEQVTQFLLYAW